jgi:serine/threonine protein kinase
VLTVEGSLASRDHVGGTAPEQVRAADRAAPPRACRRTGGPRPPCHGQDRQVPGHQEARRGATSSVVYLAHDPFAGARRRHQGGGQQRLLRRRARQAGAKLFVTEASLAGKLVHPHIVQIFDAAADADPSYIVMEYVPGGTLEPFCAPDNLLPLGRLVEMIFKCTRALDFAYRLGVIHRDIKPANILRGGTSGSDVKISDFGAAITTSSDQTQVAGIGSPAYMSPQQVQDWPLDHRTDIYSLGVVMYQLLTGQLPFQGSNNYSMMYQILNWSRRRPRRAALLRRVLRRAPCGRWCVFRAGTKWLRVR